MWSNRGAERLNNLLRTTEPGRSAKKNSNTGRPIAINFALNYRSLWSLLLINHNWEESLLKTVYKAATLKEIHLGINVIMNCILWLIFNPNIWVFLENVSNVFPFLNATQLQKDDVFKMTPWRRCVLMLEMHRHLFLVASLGHRQWWWIEDTLAVMTG